MRFSIICSGPNGLAASYDDGNGGIEHRICINVDMVWPLLVPEFTAADKAPYMFSIARTLLHELMVREDSRFVFLFIWVMRSRLTYGDSIPAAVRLIL